MELNTVRCINCQKLYKSPVKGDNHYCSAKCSQEYFERTGKN